MNEWEYISSKVLPEETLHIHLGHFLLKDQDVIHSCKELFNINVPPLEFSYKLYCVPILYKEYIYITWGFSPHQTWKDVKSSIVNRIYRLKIKTLPKNYKGE